MLKGKTPLLKPVYMRRESVKNKIRLSRGLNNNGNAISMKSIIPTINISAVGVATRSEKAPRRGKGQVKKFRTRTTG